MDKQYVVSERSHFMCPNMHFGICFTICRDYDFQNVMDALHALTESHPFLACTMQYEENSNRLYYAVSQKCQIQVQEKTHIEHRIEDYEAAGSEEWDVLHKGLLKVLLYPEEERFSVLFIAHHLLGDGRRILELACEFADYYVQGKKPVFAEERLMQGITDLPPKSELTGISKWLVNHINQQWKKEDKLVSYADYQKFLKQFVEGNPVSHASCTVTPEKVHNIRQICHKNAVSMNDYLMAGLYQTTGNSKMIIAVDISSKIACYQKGALGNYATAVSIFCREKGKDRIKTAKKVRKQVLIKTKDTAKLMLVLSCFFTMDETLLDASAISALGGYQSKAGQMAANMFGFIKRDGLSLTNLGSIINPNISHVSFIPPASPAMAQTIGVVTVNGEMRLWSSIYTDKLDIETVKIQLQDLQNT